MNEMSLGAILATGSSGSFAAGSASVSVTRSDNPAAKPGNVSCAHVAARRRVLDERQGMARPSPHLAGTSASEKAVVRLCSAIDRSRPTAADQVASGERQVSNNCGPSQPYWLLPRLLGVHRPNADIRNPAGAGPRCCSLSLTPLCSACTCSRCRRGRGPSKSGSRVRGRFDFES